MRYNAPTAQLFHLVKTAKHLRLLFMGDGLRI
jgi:hypothetical protein